jgi:hypothetical protein
VDEDFCGLIQSTFSSSLRNLETVMKKLVKAFQLMDSYIKPTPGLLRRMMILPDKKAMSFFFGYNTDDYYLCEFYRLRLSARKAFIGEDNGQREITPCFNDPGETFKFNNKAVFN